MKTPLLVAVVCAGLPGCAMQDPAAPASPDGAVFAAACGMDDASHASSALPARATVGPAPHLGTVAPSTRLPSQVMTPSMQAMARVTAAQTGQTAIVKKNSQPPCSAATLPPASKRRTGKDAGS